MLLLALSFLYNIRKIIGPTVHRPKRDVINIWYRGEQGQSITCPKCRSDRAYVETCKLNWLDDFLTGIAPLLEGDPHSLQVNDSLLGIAEMRFIVWFDS